LRNEDNAFLPLSSGQLSLLCEFCQSNKALCQAAEKTLKQHTWVSSPLQVRPSLMFNCGIRIQYVTGERQFKIRGETNSAGQFDVSAIPETSK
jgi:hypothetical protein